MGLNITVHSQIKSKKFSLRSRRQLTQQQCMYVCTYYNSIEQVGGVESIYQQEKLNFSAHFLMIGNFKNGRQALAI